MQWSFVCWAICLLVIQISYLRHLLIKKLLHIFIPPAFHFLLSCICMHFPFHLISSHHTHTYPSTPCCMWILLLLPFIFLHQTSFWNNAYIRLPGKQHAQHILLFLPLTFTRPHWSKMMPVQMYAWMWQDVIFLARNVISSRSVANVQYVMYMWQQHE